MAATRSAAAREAAADTEAKGAGNDFKAVGAGAANEGKPNISEKAMIRHNVYSGALIAQSSGNVYAGGETGNNKNDALSVHGAEAGAMDKRNKNMRIGKLYRAAAAFLAAAVTAACITAGQAEAVTYKKGPLSFDNFNTDTNLTLTKCQRDAEGEIYVPESINSRMVTDIAPQAFFSCYSITEVWLPDNVTRLGMSAFSHCYSLEYIHLPAYMYEIDGSAFSYCSALKQITLPEGITEVRSSLFYGCSALESVTIPASVSEIESSAFTSCTSLSEIIYMGSAEQWAEIELGLPNSELDGVSIRLGYGPPIGESGPYEYGNGYGNGNYGYAEPVQTTEPVTQPMTYAAGQYTGDPGYDPYAGGDSEYVGGGGWHWHGSHSYTGGSADQPDGAVDPAVSAGLAGDANCDGRVDVSDAVAVLQYIANQEKYPLYGEALLNADCDGLPGITGSDAVFIQMIDAGQL
ncbi:MAG: leucine-rich repeat protein [Ruminococcus sp.]|nr:leucine-rich repeat protein [Ruminococcus sp.]